MERTYYPLSASQQIVRLQTMMTLFKRVGNIMFALTLDNPLDRSAMTRAIEMEFDRIDSLRTRFVKKDGQLVQYFDDKGSAGKIREVTFRSQSDQKKFINSFRKGMLDPAKGQTMKVVFATDQEGRDVIFIKISHFVADTYAIGVIVTDLFGVYEALKSGTALPAAPGAFEPVLRKDTEFLGNEELLAKDRTFYEEYYANSHPEPPMYCGLHGNSSDVWLACKKKGKFSIPFRFIKCDTEGYRFIIPAAVVKEVLAWCEKEAVTPANFFYFSYALACSLRNDRAKYQHALMLLNSRSTVAEKKCAGTKVQSVGLYTTVDYDKSFAQNIKDMVAEQTEQYRHTRMSYVDVQQLQHKVWGHSALTQVDGFCYSFIPFKSPAGVSMQVHSNGKGALTGYVALMFNPDTLEVEAVYDVQRDMTAPAELAEFQNILVSSIEKVLASPDSRLAEIL